MAGESSNSCSELGFQEVLALKKVLDHHEHQQEETLKKSLLSLKDAGPFSTEMLKATSIGKTVNHLAKHAANTDVRSRAKELVRSWRQDVRKRSADDASLSGSLAAESGLNSESCDSSKEMNTNASNLHCESPCSNKASSHCPSKREVVEKRLLEALSMDTRGEDASDIARLACAIELELYQQLSGRDYAFQCRAVLYNLKEKGNKQFRASLVQGLLKPQDVPNLTADAMASTEVALAKAKIRKLAMEEVQTDWDVKHMDDLADGLFVCPKCSSKKTTYQQAQIGHGLDEPLTTFVTCLSCQNRWKFDDVGASADVDGA